MIISLGFGAAEADRVFAGKNLAGFLQKPYTVSDLMEVIAVVLGRV